MLLFSFTDSQLPMPATIQPPHGNLPAHPQTDQRAMPPRRRTDLPHLQQRDADLNLTAQPPIAAAEAFMCAFAEEVYH
jgi:hypothetical protein